MVVAMARPCPVRVVSRRACRCDDTSAFAARPRPGPSGYETAPAAAWRAAAERFAERRRDRRDGQPRPPASRGTGDGPTARARRPHRRDRPDRHPHRRQGLPLVHRRRRLGPADPRRPARRRDDARRRRARRRRHASRSTCSRRTSARRSSSSRTCTSTSAPRDGDEAQGARARRRRGGDRGRAGRAAQRPRGVARDGQPPRRLRRARGGAAASPRPAARAGTSSRRPPSRRRSASTARARSRLGLRPDVAIVVDVTHATDAPGVDAKGIGAHPFGSGPVIERGAILNPKVFELLLEVAEAEGIPYTLDGVGARDRAPTPTSIHFSRAASSRAASSHAAALHALAGRDGPARRRRQLREAARGVRAAA